MVTLTEKQHRIRLLDMDDLLLLQHFYLGGRPTSGAHLLSLTPSAVSHRMRKIEQLLGQKLFKRHGGQFSLSCDGHKLSHKAHLALETLLTDQPMPPHLGVSNHIELPAKD